MTNKRQVEIFSAGCPACSGALALVEQIACPSCEVTTLDMNLPEVAERARELGINSVPAVVVDGKLLDCCAGRGVSEEKLRAAGVGRA
ncbi:MAG: thioredoxin family protein [Bradymonadaceae bacterium]